MARGLMQVLLLAAARGCAGSGDAPDPRCARGVPGKGVCCAAPCGACGGAACGSLPGGKADCCGGTISASGKLCTAHGPPCIVAPAPLALRLSPDTAPPFPPGRRYTPAQFWAASPKLPLAEGPRRPAADFVASGEAAMVAWAPPAGAVRVTPHSDSHSLVRLLGGGPAASGTPGKSPTDADVVLRDGSGALVTKWALLWSRLDPWVNASGVAHPILVLDNVPYAFCAPGKCDAPSHATYGMDYGPNNVTEYRGWIETVLHAMSARYGEERASSFWFRVGTEPNTRPGHWNDTNAKYVEEYVAVAAAVGKVLPRAKVGLANMGADGSHWDDEVTPMARGIAKSGAQVDFIAMSCYGRGTQGRYSITTAAHCATRLEGMRALGGERWAALPAQVMEYGLQDNTLKLVDEDPGVFGAAWMLATSVVHARAGCERAFNWHYGELAFSHDDGACSPSVSPSECSLYKGTAWVQAQAGHLFGDHSNATVLEATSPGSNASTIESEQSSVDGIGGWTQNGDELMLLITAFSPVHKTTDGQPVDVEVAFDRSPQWPGGGQLQVRSSTLNRTTSTFDAIWQDGKANGWLTDPNDPNVYPLSLSRRTMLTTAGRKALEREKGPAYLEMQRQTFASTSWQGAGSGSSVVACGGRDGGECTLTMTMVPPSVVAVWVRAAPGGAAGA